MSLNFNANNLPQIQGCLSFALTKLIKELDAEKFDYCLAFGTLLGTVRHSGFIPWDDDVDLMVWEHDLPRLRRIVNTKLTPYLEVIEPDIESPVSTPMKLNLKGTYIDEKYLKDKWKINTSDFFGLSIDIFPIYRAGRFSRLFKPFNSNAFKLWSRLIIKSNSRMSSPLVHLSSNVILRFINLTQFFTLIKTLSEVGRKQSVKFVPNCSFSHFNFSLNDIIPFKKVSFEGKHCNVPNNPEAVLSVIYGPQFMTPPEIKDRTPHLDTGYIERSSPYYSFFN